MLDRLHWKKSVNHFILLIWHQVITICYPYLKKHLREQRFLTDDQIKYATEEWLKEQSELFYLRAPKTLQLL